MNKLHPAPPLSAEEAAEIEATLGPEVLRQLLEVKRTYEDQRLTTHLDLRLHFWQGPVKTAELIPVPAVTRFKIR